MERSASKDELKKAYFKLAKKYHPDTNKEDKKAAEKFAEVSNAYEALSDDSRRQRYDAMGAAGEEMGDMGGGGAGGQAGYNPEDILRDFFGSMGGGGAGGRSPFGFDMGGGGAGMGGGRRAAGMADMPIEGDDIEVVLPLTFMEAVRGANKTISVHAQAACSTCQGSGNQPNSQPTTCKQCQGKGVVSKPHTQHHTALLLAVYVWYCDSTSLLLRVLIGCMLVLSCLVLSCRVLSCCVVFTANFESGLLQDQHDLPALQRSRSQSPSVSIVLG